MFYLACRVNEKESYQNVLQVLTFTLKNAFKRSLSSDIDTHLLVLDFFPACDQLHTPLALS